MVHYIYMVHYSVLQAALESIVAELDSVQGCVFSSKYEYPGRYTRCLRCISIDHACMGGIQHTGSIFILYRPHYMALARAIHTWRISVRWDIGFSRPPLRLTCWGRRFCIESLNSRGEAPHAATMWMDTCQYMPCMHIILPTIQLHALLSSLGDD